MTLSSLRDFLLLESGAELGLIAQHFGLDAVNLQAILKHWEKKGKLTCQACKSNCGDCVACPLRKSNDRYCWVVD